MKLCGKWVYLEASWADFEWLYAFLWRSTWFWRSASTFLDQNEVWCVVWHQKKLQTQNGVQYQRLNSSNGRFPIFAPFLTLFETPGATMQLFTAFATGDTDRSKNRVFVPPKGKNIHDVFRPAQSRSSRKSRFCAVETLFSDIFWAMKMQFYVRFALFRLDAFLAIYLYSTCPHTHTHTFSFYSTIHALY